MINPNLEEHLQCWCENQDNDLFTNHLYLPLKYLAAHIAEKYNVSTNEIETTISDMVSHAATTLPIKLNKSKGTAKALLYVIMSNWLVDKLRSEGRDKRGKAMTVYLEDMSVDNINANLLYEVQVDDIEDLRGKLDNIDISGFTSNQKKVAKKLVDILKKDNVKNDYVHQLSKACKCQPNLVYKVMAKLRKIN